jgi:hypothetical protein
MIQLFSLKGDTEAKVIGRSYPQISDTPTKELVDENTKRVEEEKFQVIPPGGYGAKIGKSTKLTDMLSSFMVTGSPIVSEKFANFLRPFIVPRHRLIPINIFRVKELVTEKKYFIMQLFGNDIPNVNFRKSTFDFYMGGATLDKNLLQFENYEDYIHKYETVNHITKAIVKKLIMRTSLKNQLFYLKQLASSHLFVTEPVKEAMDKENITGFKIVEVGYVED